jgi:hypothetical protein
MTGNRNDKTLRQIFEVLIRIERLLKKNEIKEEPKKQVLKGNE